MTYDDAMQSTVTRHDAQWEIEQHSADWGDFLAECGDREEYSGAEVLEWLGY